MIALPDNMCLDRHVPDFLECLRCWLPRTFGKRPYRLRCLDLSRNALSDASIVRVMDCLKTEDLRIERLCLAGNCVQKPGVTAITEFVWNSNDALVEIDLSDNEITEDPKNDPGSGVVSALLRCLYNHRAYPLTIDHGHEGMKVLPFLLRVGGNGICYPEKLLKQIRTKGGKEHVKVCPSAEPYPVTGKEYLSVCVPDFLSQRALNAPQQAQMQLRDAPPAAEAAPAVVLTPAPAAPAPEAAPAAQSGQRRKRSRSRGKKRRKDGDGKRGRRTKAAVAAGGGQAAAAELAPAPRAEGSVAPGDAEAAVERAEDVPDWGRRRPGAGRGSASSRSASSAVSRNGRAGPANLGIVEGQVIAQRAEAPSKEGEGRALNEDDQKRLQRDVDHKLLQMDGLPSEQSTRDMLAEFVVCMMVAKKDMRDITAEMTTFLGEHTQPFMDWFERHVEEQFDTKG